MWVCFDEEGVVLCLIWFDPPFPPDKLDLGVRSEEKNGWIGCSCRRRSVGDTVIKNKKLFMVPNLRGFLNVDMRVKRRKDQRGKGEGSREAWWYICETRRIRAN